ncbi:MAG: hypothetical protein E6Q97_04660 [Desulfurellales bacterium]|nr:MAG: hypothetical protein E6Q97_04660 [Desulfurellales bacterium]
MAIELKQGKRSELSEWTVDVVREEELLFSLGFLRPALISDFAYVTLFPTPAIATLKVSELKELRKLFSGIHGWRLFCQIEKGKTVEAKWAEFFGFERKEVDLPERWQYEKDTR